MSSDGGNSPFPTAFSSLPAAFGGILIPFTSTATAQTRALEMMHKVFSISR